MKQWEITINGTQNTVVFVPNQWTGKHKLIINGKEVALKTSPFQAFVGTDQPVNIAGKECRFVLIGNKADIAVDGMYIGSNKPYVPLKSMPWWIWIFIVMCVAIPIISLGGILPIAIAILCSISCIRIGVSPNIGTTKKLLCCFGITALAWTVFGVLLFIISSI